MIDGKLNLINCSLQKLIRLSEMCGLLEIDSRTLSNLDEITFTYKFAKDTLQGFNLAQAQFSPFDHRRIAEILSKEFPERFIIGKEPFFVFEFELSNFYIQLYSISAEAYAAAYKAIDDAFGLQWWRKAISTFGERALKARENFPLDFDMRIREAPRNALVIPEGPRGA